MRFLTHYSLTSVFKNVNIKGDGTEMRLYCLLGSGSSYTEDVNISWDNVHVDNRLYSSGDNGTKHSIVFYAVSGTHIYNPVHMTMNNSSVKGFKNFGWINSGNFQETRHFNFIDCDIQVGQYGLFWAGQYFSYSERPIYVDFLRTTVVSYSGHEIFNLSPDTTHFIRLYFNSVDSEFASSGPLVKAHGIRASLGHGIGEFVARSTVFNVDNIIYFDSSSGNAYLGTIDIQNCTIRNASYVYRNDGVYPGDDINFVFKDNVLDEVVSFIRTPNIEFPVGDITFRGVSLSGVLFEGKVTDGRVIVEDSVVLGSLTDSNAKAIFFDITNSYVDGLAGAVSANIVGSRVQSDGFVLSGGASADFTDCHIVSNNESISATGSLATLSLCNIQTSSSSQGVIKALNSSVNAEYYDVYMEGGGSMVSNVLEARDGNTGAFKISFDGLRSPHAYFSELTLPFNGSDTTYSICAIFSSQRLLDTLSASLQYVSDGKLKTIASTSIEVDDGVWDTYDASVLKKKIVFDVPDTDTIATGSKVRVLLSVIGKTGEVEYLVTDKIVGA